MAVKLRLRRMGKKRQPVYKVVAADVRSPRDGKFIEAIGLYNPKTEPATIEIEDERALYWLGVGAQPTDTVKNLLSKTGVLLRRELVKQGLSEEDINTKMEEFFKNKEEKNAKVKSELADKAKKAAEKAAAELKAKEEAKAAAAAEEAKEESSEEEQAEA
ncbi:MAG: 30S ribosomal protein S16 [Rhodothermaceae bacterium]